MHVFVTGATGHIGHLVVAELLRHGHDVTGLARTPEAADRLRADGARPVEGSLDDLGALSAAAAAADGVAHLAFQHGSTQDEAAAADLAAVEAMADALAGTGKALVVTSGVAGLMPGHVLSENDVPDLADVPARIRTEAFAISQADRGIRSSAIRLAPTVHGPADVHGFVPQLMRTAEQRGVSAWVGDGTARWTAVHEEDAAVLFRLAVESAPAATRLHGVAEESVPYREIAEAIGARLGLPTASIPAEEAVDHFGWLGALVGLDMPATAATTRYLLDWSPTRPHLMADIADVLRPATG